MKYLILFLVLSLSTPTFGQATLEKIFCAIPKKMIGLNQEQRKSLIDSGKMRFYYIDYEYTNVAENFECNEKFNCKSTSTFSINFDSKSGYMEWYETDMGSYLTSEYALCYWNLSKKSKLIAITQKHNECCSPPSSSITFYSFIDDNISELKTANILPFPSLPEIMNLDEAKAQGLDPFEYLPIYDKPLLLNYELPQTGKDIKCSVYSYDEYVASDQDQYRLYQKHHKYYKNEILFEWEQGYFKIK